VTFEGISFAALDFYEDLEADNATSCWTTHRHLYDEQVKAALQEPAAELSPEFGAPTSLRPLRDVRSANAKRRKGSVG
jgi:hypothetical protein